MTVRNKKKSEKLTKYNEKNVITLKRHKSKIKKRKLSKKDNSESISNEIAVEIYEACCKNSSLFLHTILDRTAILTKKITVTTIEVNNNSIFSPVESQPKRTFFHTFIITWKDKDKFLRDVRESVIYFGLPIYYAKTPQEVFSIIEDI